MYRNNEDIDTDKCFPSPTTDYCFVWCRVHMSQITGLSLFLSLIMLFMFCDVIKFAGENTLIQPPGVIAC